MPCITGLEYIHRSLFTRLSERVYFYGFAVCRMLRRSTVCKNAAWESHTKRLFHKACSVVPATLHWSKISCICGFCLRDSSVVKWFPLLGVIMSFVISGSCKQEVPKPNDPHSGKESALAEALRRPDRTRHIQRDAVIWLLGNFPPPSSLCVSLLRVSWWLKGLTGSPQCHFCRRKLGEACVCVLLYSRVQKIVL